MKEQPNRVSQHLSELGGAKRLAMQSSERVSQARILRFHTGHVSLADDLITVWNKTWIDLPPVGDIEVALPLLNNPPQWSKGLSAMVSQHPV